MFAGTLAATTLNWFSNLLEGAISCFDDFL